MIHLTHLVAPPVYVHYLLATDNGLPKLQNPGIVSHETVLGEVIITVVSPEELSEVVAPLQQCDLTPRLFPLRIAMACLLIPQPPKASLTM